MGYTIVTECKTQYWKDVQKSRRPRILLRIELALVAVIAQQFAHSN